MSRVDRRTSSEADRLLALILNEEDEGGGVTLTPPESQAEATLLSPGRRQAELQGEVVTAKGVSDEGMLMDFSDVSKILEEHIHDVVDHAFIVFEGDTHALQALSIMGDRHRTVVVPFVPTAENLAKWAFEQVESHINSTYGNEISLTAFHVRETPKSWASWSKSE